MSRYRSFGTVGYGFDYSYVTSGFRYMYIIMQTPMLISYDYIHVRDASATL